MAITAIIGGVASLAAANIQSNAAKSIQGQQLAAGQTASGKLQPFVDVGQSGADAMQQNMNYLTTPYAPTQAQLEATPGYQFTLNQGLLSTQNAAASKGLGISGAALKSASRYATGLANSTYATNAGIYQKNQAQIGNYLTGLTGIGANAAAGQANAITGQSNAAAQTGMSGAQARASGIMGFSNGLTNAGSFNYQNNLVNNIIKQNSATGVATPLPKIGF